jgi:hypothetical protein
LLREEESLSVCRICGLMLGPETGFGDIAHAISTAVQRIAERGATIRSLYRRSVYRWFISVLGKW